MRNHSTNIRAAAGFHVRVVNLCNTRSETVLSWLRVLLVSRRVYLVLLPMQEGLGFSSLVSINSFLLCAFLGHLLEEVFLPSCPVNIFLLLCLACLLLIDKID